MVHPLQGEDRAHALFQGQGSLGQGPLSSSLRNITNGKLLYLVRGGHCDSRLNVESVMPSNHLILCQPLLLFPSIFPRIRDFSNESVFHIRWPKYWSFSFNISPSNEYSRLISSRIDWLDLLAVQGTLKSLLQHHSSTASILWHSAFFIVQLSHPYMTTGNTIALTKWTFVGKVMSLLFNMLPRLVITFLPRRKRLLISYDISFQNLVQILVEQVMNRAYSQSVFLTNKFKSQMIFPSKPKIELF